jgi:3-deoxy-manno-octulosonate cytidylyltransferase (CMP-KDO synthetase)
MNRDTEARYVIVIPARYASRRLPGKALRDINGRSLLEHVWRRARASAAAQVVIATDDRRILAAAEDFGARAVMTSPEHASGSDRTAECAGLLGWADDQVIVNLQGDEPLMPPQCLDQVAGLLEPAAGADAATLYWPVSDAAEAADPNAVKVVVGQGGEALFFSRAILPYPRDFASVEEAFAAGVRWYRHLGLYAYRKSSLDRFAATTPTPLERAEHLEQLRFLESGGRILAARACQAIPAGIDTEKDLERVRTLLK